MSMHLWFNVPLECFYNEILLTIYGTTGIIYIYTYIGLLEKVFRSNQPCMLRIEIINDKINNILCEKAIILLIEIIPKTKSSSLE